jgi:propanediol dehydratase large subunit
VDSRRDDSTRVDASARELAVIGPNETWPSATVEDRLAVALERASAVGRWDVVAQLARELEAKRLAMAGVTGLAGVRARTVATPDSVLENVRGRSRLGELPDG